jgi:futalosine hydrolase
MLPRLLIVTAVAAERDAVLAGLGDVRVLPHPLAPDAAQVDVEVVGVGPARAAAGTALRLAQAQAAGAPYQAVICAGIAGGLPGRAAIGEVVVATESVAADLGAETPDGFLSIDELGFGTGTLPAEPALFPSGGARTGTILTVTTATGTTATADALASRYPDAVAEAMEGFGVATAAAESGLPYAEVRAISNLVGPRDPTAWRLGAALAALTEAFTIRELA